ncbi:MAG TPA: gamma-glutamylcyclotransferase [Oceanospirillaceae bacterium]|nr:gamma-glutamylcyclotransferase [Oceanospirillaceae bacterium]
MSAYPQHQILSALDDYLTAFPLPNELWIFAYGSLMWNPEMQVVDTQQGKVLGLKRGFNLLSTVHRGTVEHPGLVLSLREGGDCEGLAFRIAGDTKETDFKNLWLREMVTMFYRPHMCQVVTGNGVVNAITFVADQQHEQFVDYDPAQCAQMIAQAHGGRGSNIEYFNNTQQQLNHLNIKDPLFSEIAAHWPNPV